MVRCEAVRPGRHGTAVAGINEALSREDGTGDGCSLREGFACQKRLCPRIRETGRNPLDWSLRIERQPRGAGFRDGDLADEELGAAAHPEPHDASRPDAK